APAGAPLFPYTTLFRSQGIAVRGRNVVADCVAVVAKDQCVHPVREYLESLTWDGTKRIQKWLVDYLGATGNPEYLSAVGRCWLRSEEHTSELQSREKLV